MSKLRTKLANLNKKAQYTDLVNSINAAILQEVQNSINNCKVGQQDDPQEIFKLLINKFNQLPPSSTIGIESMASTIMSLLYDYEYKGKRAFNELF